MDIKVNTNPENIAYDGHAETVSTTAFVNHTLYTIIVCIADHMTVPPVRGPTQHPLPYWNDFERVYIDRLLFILYMNVGPVKMLLIQFSFGFGIGVEVSRLPVRSGP